MKPIEDNKHVFFSIGEVNLSQKLHTSGGLEQSSMCLLLLRKDCQTKGFFIF